jgi:hypothetical protein
MAERPAQPATEPVAVDASLIDEMLRLSPVERLRQNDRAASLALKLRAAFAARQQEWSNRKT